MGIGKAEVALALLTYGYGVLTHVTISALLANSISELVWTLVMLIFWSFLGMTVVSLVAVFVILALHPLGNLLEADCENVFCGMFIGGTVGLVLTLPLWFFGTVFFSLFWIGTVTVFGQLGGGWGARKSLRDLHSFEIPSWPTTFQFGVRQLLLLTFWCAVILTGLKLAGILTGRVLACLAFWSALQLVGIAFVAISERKKRRRLMVRST
ncbi:MAG: hypothetical protein GXP24_13050 [Planctomycetes bacterium]|nr:hypothetical protein [Planctomycetota bacterium]